MDRRTLLAMVFAFRLLGAIPFAPLLSMVDAFAFDTLNAQRNRWGVQRLWGTIAWGVNSVIVGKLIDLSKSFYPMFISFCLFNVSQFVFVIKCLKWPYQNAAKGQSGPTEPVDVKASVLKLLREPIFIFNCVVALCSGVFLSFIYAVQPLYVYYLKADGDGANTILGVNQAVVCGTEIPILLIAMRLVDKLGEGVIFSAMFASYALRFFLYSTLTESTIHLMPLIEPLHVFNFGLFWSAASRLTAIMAPSGASATAQAIISTMYFSIGLSIGLAVGMQSVDAFGYFVFFRVTAAVAAVLALLTAVATFLVFRKKIRELHEAISKQMPNDASANGGAKMAELCQSEVAVGDGSGVSLFADDEKKD